MISIHKIGTSPSTTVIAARQRRHRWPIFLGLGANISGAWGGPRDTLERAIHELGKYCITPLMHSGFFTSEPIGYRAQPWFINAVVAVDCDIPPSALLRVLKKLEREAGRRVSLRWGPRPLDIDILDYRGALYSVNTISSLPNRLTLPHPGITGRGFVLLPLALVAPGWRHPILGVGAKTLLARRPGLARSVRPT